jgi:hypothetical protein
MVDCSDATYVKYQMAVPVLCHVFEYSTYRKNMSIPYIAIMKFCYID